MRITVNRKYANIHNLMTCEYMFCVNKLLITHYYEMINNLAPLSQQSQTTWAKIFIKDKTMSANNNNRKTT